MCFCRGKGAVSSPLPEECFFGAMPRSYNSNCCVSSVQHQETESDGCVFGVTPKQEGIRKFRLELRNFASIQKSIMYSLNSKLHGRFYYRAPPHRFYGICIKEIPTKNVELRFVRQTGKLPCQEIKYR